MSQPLSPLSPSNQNRITPPTIKRETNHEDKSLNSPNIDSYLAKTSIEAKMKENAPLNGSSPPLGAKLGFENLLPRKRPHSPNKDLSPAKPPPAKRHTSTMLTEEALKKNDELTKAIAIFEDDSGIHYDDESPTKPFEASAGYESMDESCFSAFSAVPNADMTAFARLVKSPAKSNAGSPAKQQRQAQYHDLATPRHGMKTPGTGRRHGYDDVSPIGSPTPRHKGVMSGADTTNLLIDFTEQFNAFATGAHRGKRGSPTKYNTHSELSSHASGRRASSRHMGPPATPSYNRPHLLDFDIPPAPTPRSVPTITAREIESMKSGYLSEISSMKATVSGKEAEVNSLKQAVVDAERRVGEALEQLREEKGAKDALGENKADWEKRGKDMESVLQTVKEQMLRLEVEQEDLTHTLQRSERMREEAETRATEAESRVTRTRAGSINSNGSSGAAQFGMVTLAEKDAAVASLAQELHTAYKKKHEEKVASLKKSYEGRYDKRIRSLERQVAEGLKENEELRARKDATFSNVVTAPAPTTVPTVVDEAQQQALEHQLTNLKADKMVLADDLERERQANVALVATVEEFFRLEAASSSPSGDEVGKKTVEKKTTGGAVARPSGIKGPGFGTTSRIGRVSSGFGAGAVAGAGAGAGGVGMGRSRSGSGGSGGSFGGVARGVGMGVGAGGGIRGSIERMGRGGA